MKVHERNVVGAPVRVLVVESEDDAGQFRAWIDERASGPVAIDTETTGLNDRVSGWELRLVQFGDPYTGWVLPAGRRSDIQYALSRCAVPVFHNRPFDASALTRAGFEHHAWSGGRDTQILAHLVDSRSSRDGGVGHGLKALADHYIQPGLSDDQVELKSWARSNKVTVSEMFATCPIELLEAYAGMDVVLTSWLFPMLLREVADIGCAGLEEF